MTEIFKDVSENGKIKKPFLTKTLYSSTPGPVVALQ